MSDPKKRRYARRITPCAGCGKRGRRVKALCADCLGYESNALIDGAWVIDLRRRVLVWREDVAS